MNEQELKEIEARLNAATPGPWKWSDESQPEYLESLVESGGPYEYMETEDYVEWLADYRFKKELEEKAKKKVKLEEDLRNKEYTLKRNKEEVEELKKRLLNS